MKIFNKSDEPSQNNSNMSFWSRITKPQRKQLKKTQQASLNNDNNNNRKKKKSSSTTSIPPKIRLTNDNTTDDIIYDENEDSGCVISGGGVIGGNSNPIKSYQNSGTNDTSIGVNSIVTTKSTAVSTRKESILSNSATSGSVNFRLSLQSLRGNSGSVNRQLQNNPTNNNNNQSNNSTNNNKNNNNLLLPHSALFSQPQQQLSKYHKSSSGCNTGHSSNSQCKLTGEQLEAKLKTSKHQCEQLKRKVANLSLECQKLENQCQELKEVKDQLINLQSDLSMLKRKDKVSSEIQQRINNLEEDNYHMRNHIDKLRSKIKEISFQLDPEIINKRLDTLEEENSQLTSISLQNRRNHEAFSLDVGNQLVETFITQQTIYDEFRRLQHRLISVERQNQIMADLIHLHCHQNNMIGNYSNNSSVDNSRHSDRVMKLGAVECNSQPTSQSQQNDDTANTTQHINGANESVHVSMTNNALQEQQGGITTIETGDTSKSSVMQRNSMRDYYSDSPILFSSSNVHNSNNNPCTNIHDANASNFVSHNVVQQIIDNDGRPLSFASSSITTPTYYSEDRIINNNNRNASSQTNIDGLSSDPNDSNYIYHSLNKKMSECQMSDYYQINFSYYNTNNTGSATTLSKTSNILNTTKHAHPHLQQQNNPEQNQELNTQNLHQVNTNNPFYCTECHGNSVEQQQAQNCHCFEQTEAGLQQIANEQQNFESQLQMEAQTCANVIPINDSILPATETEKFDSNIQSNAAPNIVNNTQNESPCSLRTAGAGDDGYFSTSTNRTVTTLMMTASNDSASILTKAPGMPNNTASITSTPIIYDENKDCDREYERESQLFVVLLDKKQRYLMLSYHVQKSKCRSVRKLDIADNKEYTVQLSMDLETSLWSRNIRRRQHQQRDINSISPPPPNRNQSSYKDNLPINNQEKASKSPNSQTNTDIQGNNSDIHVNNASNQHQLHNNMSCCSCIMTISNDTTSSQNSCNNSTHNNNNNTSQISTNSFSSNSALVTSVNSYSNASSWRDDQILVFSDTELYGTRFHIDSDLEGDEEDLSKFSRKVMTKQAKSEVTRNTRLFTPKVTPTHIPIPVSSSPQLRAHNNKTITQEVRARSSLPPLIENKQINNSGSEKRKVEIRSQRRNQHYKSHSNSKLIPPKIRPRSVPTNNNSPDKKPGRSTPTQISSDLHKPPTQHKPIKYSSSSKPPHPSSSSSSSSTNLSSPSLSKSKPATNNSKFLRYYNQSTIPPPIPPRSITNNRRNHKQQQPSPLVTGTKIPAPQDYVNTATSNHPSSSTSNSPSLLTHNYHEDEEIDDMMLYDRDLLMQLENYQLPSSCLNTVVLQHFK